MELPDFTEFAPFNGLREKMEATELGYFELFDPAVHLTGNERSELENGGILRRLDEVKFLPDNTLAIKNSRVLLYNPDENYYRSHREFPTYHVARCSRLEQSMAEHADREYLVTTRLAEDYPLLKLRPGAAESSDSAKSDSISSPQNAFASSVAPVSLVLHSLVVCKDCLHKLRYRDYDQYRNRKRGYSQRVLDEFRLQDFFRLYPMYPLSFGARPSQDKANTQSD